MDAVKRAFRVDKVGKVLERVVKAEVVVEVAARAFSSFQRHPSIDPRSFSLQAAAHKVRVATCGASTYEKSATLWQCLRRLPVFMRKKVAFCA